MESTSFERRKEKRTKVQQQPQQSAYDNQVVALTTTRSVPESPRKTFQDLADEQARKQSNKL